MNLVELMFYAATAVGVLSIVVAMFFLLRERLR
jgi:hypothetical protein